MMEIVYEKLWKYTVNLDDKDFNNLYWYFSAKEDGTEMHEDFDKAGKSFFSILKLVKETSK